MTTPRAATLPALASHYLGQYLSRIRHCVGLLSEEEVWWRPAPGSNTIGNLMLHLAGNLSLWVLNALGGEAHPRHRGAEFAADRSAAKTDLLDRLTEVVESARGVIERLDDEDLAAPKEIQGYRTDGRGALFHAVEHMSYHTGQIVWVTKQLTAGREEIEFYPQHRGE
jgi:uncharacterized damage-inducible protein DinB